MEIKVNDYVRTDTGIIEKLEGIHEQNKTSKTIIKLNKMGGGRYAHILDINSEFVKEFDKDFSRGNIIKSSPRIIDLIKVGDVLIIKDFVDEACMIFTDIYLIQNETQLLNIKSDLEKNKNKKLYSIVTKEQFEQMEYKVGE